ncbi:hypothetical protein EVAR_81291_1 [Eumeta japonica]|uniref:Uncharacterized protein n=1 Tax=Eumeta variegata TaxID=151549 RepID=A0A4C1VZA9_EUMVA|nr:hypothetical protein EVAR_81291_1 [Eumeta japonica]
MGTQFHLFSLCLTTGSNIGLPKAAHLVRIHVSQFELDITVCEPNAVNKSHTAQHSGSDVLIATAVAGGGLQAPISHASAR